MSEEDQSINKLSETSSSIVYNSDQQTDVTKPENDGKEVLSPIIEKIRWGSIEVEGFGNFKDVKISPGNVQEWDWLETDTHHEPGIVPKDVQDLIDKKCEIIILSKGMHDQLNTSKETLDLLKEIKMKKNQDYFILSSEEAVKRYNKFAKEKKRVGALIHSTC